MSLWAWLSAEGKSQVHLTFLEFKFKRLKIITTFGGHVTEMSEVSVYAFMGVLPFYRYYQIRITI